MSSLVQSDLEVESGRKRRHLEEKLSPARKLMRSVTCPCPSNHEYDSTYVINSGELSRSNSLRPSRSDGPEVRAASAASKEDDDESSSDISMGYIVMGLRAALHPGDQQSPRPATQTEREMFPRKH